MAELEVSQPATGPSLECGPSSSFTPHSGQEEEGARGAPHFNLKPQMGSGGGLGRKP